MKKATKGCEISSKYDQDLSGSTVSDLKVIIVELRIANASLQKQVKVLTEELEIANHNLVILQRIVFGKRSEKLKREQIDELKEASQDEFEHTKFEGSVNKSIRSGRKVLPKDLPRQQIIYDLDEAEKICHCGCALTKIGSEISEQLEYVPASFKVIEHIRYKYGCKGCEDTIKRARVPDKPIAKANASSGLLAYILVSKFENHIPLYRQSQIWERSGISIARSTLSNWVLRCGAILAPLVELLKQDLARQNYICSDETPLQVLSNTTLSYMWIHISGERNNRAVIYDYQDSRSGEQALKFLNKFKGYHQCDAYSGYNELHKKKGIVCVGCWAHARRKFYEITKIVKKPGFAHEMVKLIGLLYDIERKAKKAGLDPGAIKALRQEEGVPILQEIKKLLDEYKSLVTPKGMLGKAIGYSLNQWEALNAYLQDGRIRIDNNDCEGIIKPFAVGRKNWLFNVTIEGAKASANIYSIIQTARANNINSYNYLMYVLQKIKAVKTKDELRALLPYNINKSILLSNQ